LKVVGIDPGVSGAIAVADTDSPSDVIVYRFPSVVLPIGGKKRKRLDLCSCWAMLAGLISAFEPELCVLEDVNGFSGNAQSTGASGFVFGRAAGNIEGMLVALSVPRQYVTPVVWKKHFKLQGKGPELKTASRIMASQLFPLAAQAFSLVKDDGPAEAALLAHYGMTHLRNTK
jgi:crossover junction endodeoxyribonuclease RuvC